MRLRPLAACVLLLALAACANPGANPGADSGANPGARDDPPRSSGIVSGPTVSVGGGINLGPDGGKYRYGY